MDLTRRQAIGLGAVALGALRLPSPAVAADSGPALFELRIADLAATTAWQTTPVLQAPRRFDLVGLRWGRGGGGRRPGRRRAARGRGGRVHGQVRARTRGGRWTRWTPLPHAHGPLTATDPAFTGAADELQLRL